MESADGYNILLSSAGRRVHLLQIWERALGALGIEGHVAAVDASPLAAAFQRASRRWLVPRCDDSSFVDRMLDICESNDIRLIIPTIDPELPVYAGDRARFEAVGTSVAVSGPRTVEIGADKVRTHEWFRSAGIPTVEQAPLGDVLGAGHGWSFPLFIKPRFGSAGKGVRLLSTADELAMVEDPEDKLVQTVAPGVEYTIDVLVDRQGIPRCAVPRRRLEVRAGEVSKGVTVRQPEIVELAVEMAASLPDAMGPLTMQVFHDGSTGELNAIEMNPRFGGGFPLAWEAGARFPQWLIEEYMGLAEPRDHHTDWKDGVVMLRYDGAVFTDAASVGL